MIRCHVVNLKLTLQYDGTDFSGFAAQPGKRTIRSELEKALLKLFKKPVKFFAASRTDAGVHALGQVISFNSKLKIQKAKLRYVLNNLLPEDIRVVKTEEAGGKFNARFSAKSKKYEYLIFNGGDIPVLLRKLAWQVKLPLKLSAMRRAAKYLIGKHDFTSFCAAGAREGSKVRTIYRIVLRKVKRYGITLLAIEIEGNGFLYRMVRNIVGTLLEVGTGRFEPDRVKEVLKVKDRRKAGRCAPSRGLYLMKVDH
ncbi:tRNA pseudouridine(38-40) synthase TruA [Candidatus Saganbacteria bacterium]|nr:tRNA pseudouridine(38-40) synthase TruA [Candidatus Saganbacteria bacterium]